MENLTKKITYGYFVFVSLQGMTSFAMQEVVVEAGQQADTHITGAQDTQVQVRTLESLTDAQVVLEQAQNEDDSSSPRKSCLPPLPKFCLGLHHLKSLHVHEGAALMEETDAQKSPTHYQQIVSLLERLSPRTGDQAAQEGETAEVIEEARAEARELLISTLAAASFYAHMPAAMMRVPSREELQQYICIATGEHDVNGLCMKCMCTDDKHRPDCVPCKHGIPGCEAQRCAEINGEALGCQQCSIGLEFVPADGEILKCNHYFCSEHIKEYERANKLNSCPMCRAKIEYREKCLHCKCRFEFYPDRDEDKTKDDSITIPCKVFYWSYLTDRFEEYIMRDSCLQPQELSHRYHVSCYQKVLSELADGDACKCPAHRAPTDDALLYQHYVGYLQLPGRPDCHTAFMRSHILDMQPDYESKPVLPPIVVNACSSLITTFGRFFK